MALRNVVKYGDPILRKKSRTVEVFDRRIATLVEDMFETMYKDNGVGLAAVQVGILKRIVVIDCANGRSTICLHRLPVVLPSVHRADRSLHHC